MRKRRNEGGLRPHRQPHTVKPTCKLCSMTVKCLEWESKGSRVEATRGSWTGLCSSVYSVKSRGSVITEACQSRVSNSRVMGSGKSGMQKWLASPWLNWPHYMSWNISPKMTSKTGPLISRLAPGSTFNCLIGMAVPETHQTETKEGKPYFSLNFPIALPKQHTASSFLQLPATDMELASYLFLPKLIGPGQPSTVSPSSMVSPKFLTHVSFPEQSPF